MATADRVRSLLTTMFPGADVTVTVGEDGRESVTLARTTVWIAADEKDYEVAVNVLERHGQDVRLSWGQRVAALVGPAVPWDGTRDRCVFHANGGDVELFVRHGFEAVEAFREYWVPTEYVVTQPGQDAIASGAPWRAVWDAARACERHTTPKRVTVTTH